MDAGTEPQHITSQQRGVSSEKHGDAILTNSGYINLNAPKSRGRHMGGWQLPEVMEEQ